MIGTILSIALVLYVLGVLYGAWIGLNILGAADCDHAYLIMLPVIFLAVVFWPLALLFGIFLRLTGNDD